jgi:hypothetical protein
VWHTYSNPPTQAGIVSHQHNNSLFLHSVMQATATQQCWQDCLSQPGTLVTIITSSTAQHSTVHRSLPECQLRHTDCVAQYTTSHKKFQA